jgi:putative zinc finger protein/FecR-like protein
MFGRHVVNALTRYCDGDLSPADRQRVDAHLVTCVRCRSALEEIQFSARLVQQLKVVTAPPLVWDRIEETLSASSRRHSRSYGWGLGPGPWGLGLRWAFAGALSLVAVASAYWMTRETTPRPWAVTRASDNDTRRMAAGEWVETGSGSRARIIVGQLGTVDVAAETRVRLGKVSESEYRLSLARGTISAEIDAPPRLFIVDTPASTVVDLGCAYTVTVGDDGAGVLRMTKGWSALEWKGRQSLVPAGAMCRTTPVTGPGTPYFEDASAALKRAVDEFDKGTNPSQALEVVIAEARVRDTLTLWHLLSRVDAPDRVRVYERIAQFEPLPAGITRDQILALDAGALRKWREELAWKW